MSRARRSDKRPPSRLRYEESHPVVTLRLPLDVYRRFKEHLVRDDAGAEAIAEALAREKDGLGREIERRHKELDSLDDLVKQRDNELAISREAERAKMLKAVAVERESRFESIASEAQLTRQLRMGNLAGLDANIAARKMELARLIGDIAGQRMTQDLIERELKDREQLKERLAKEAVDQARRGECLRWPA